MVRDDLGFGLSVIGDEDAQIAGLDLVNEPAEVGSRLANGHGNCFHGHNFAHKPDRFKPQSLTSKPDQPISFRAQV